MALTLKEATVGMANHVDQTVIEEIRKNSRAMDKIPFDDAVSPGTGGSTLVYAYQKIKTPGKAGGRKLNEEYTPQEAKRELASTSLAIMGGSFEIDRVIAKNSSKAIDEVSFQLEQKAKATVAEFQYNMINGDSEADETQFTGLKKLLTGTQNDFTADTIDLSGTITEAKANAANEQLNKLVLSLVGGKATSIYCNTQAFIKIQSVANKLGYRTESEDAFGNPVLKFGSAEIIDLGEYSNGETTVDVIPTTAGVTQIYAVREGLDAWHGVTPQGTGVAVETHTPDFTEAKAVHKGDVEMVAAMVLKNTRAAAVINVKVA